MLVKKISGLKYLIEARVIVLNQLNLFYIFFKGEKIKKFLYKNRMIDFYSKFLSSILLLLQNIKLNNKKISIVKS